MINNLKIIITCVNYADYLEYTLPHNKNIYPDITVFTDTSDKETIDICTQNTIPFITLENLGLYNECFDHVSKRKCYEIFLKNNINQWILFIDADILLPRLLFNQLETLNLDKEKIYCTSRVYLPMDYPNLLANINIAKNADQYNNLNWTHLQSECWGYFLLFFNSTKLKPWNTNDVDFCNKNWPSCQHRVHLPGELAVAHIPHGTWDDWGKNFYGRKTPNLKTFIRTDI